MQKSRISLQIKNWWKSNYYWRFKEAGDILKDFDNRDEAIKFLVNEAKLLEEGFVYYNIIMKIEDLY